MEVVKGVLDFVRWCAAIFILAIGNAFPSWLYTAEEGTDF